MPVSGHPMRKDGRLVVLSVNDSLDGTNDEDPIISYSANWNSIDHDSPECLQWPNE